jgi:tellurite resistance protein
MSPNARAMRKATPAEKEKMDRAKARIQEGVREGDKKINKIFPTLQKAARDQTKKGQREMEEIPEEVLQYESAMANEPGSSDMSEPKKYKKVGMVTSRGQGKVMRKRPTRMC